MSEHTIERPPKLHELVARRIQELVISGRWKMGSRLPTERELCTQFAVSRTVIREALRVLIARGLLKELPGRGTVVSENVGEPLRNFLDVFLARKSQNGLGNLVEVRKLLEVEIAGLAAERASEEEISDLARINGSLRRLHEARKRWSEEDTRRFVKLDFEFHAALAKCTKNDMFVILLDRLGDALMSTWAQMCHRSEVRVHGVEKHEKVLQAIRSRDARAARRATRGNLKSFLGDASRIDQGPRDGDSPACLT